MTEKLFYDALKNECEKSYEYEFHDDESGGAEITFYTPMDYEYVIYLTNIKDEKIVMRDLRIEYENFNPEEWVEEWAAAKYQDKEGKSNIPGVYALIDEAEYIDDMLEKLNMTAHEIYNDLDE